jgi:acetyl/propionyl-CoA carboxylase alpha subunit/acetyl-CoA carboxylase carboxyltransferase component
MSLGETRPPSPPQARPKLDFSRILVVNRGEPAIRLIRAARELSVLHETNLRTIVLLSDADAQSSVAREADETVSLGPALVPDPESGRRRSAYLDYARLEAAIASSRAEAVWVGWGFVAEHAEFAELCARLGVVFIGPPAEVIRRLGDKVAAKRLAMQAEVPIAPWSEGPVETLEEARRWVERLGLPVLCKASAGGGGRGIRKVHAQEELAEAFESARAEARQAFGDPRVYLEKKLVGVRHVEVQVLGDRHGTIWAVGVRDCTLQRRSQKVVEESPSPALSREQEDAVKAAAVRLCREVGYVNAGTVEFLFDQRSGRFAFMEVNTRLQVEHPVTEMTTGLDLVQLQLLIASGHRLEGEPPPGRGHAIEVRLNAEDPDNRFAPAPGRVSHLRLPAGPGLRTDFGVVEGDRVPPEFDSMIGKIIAWGQDRDEALARLRRALQETSVVLEGGASNKAYLLELLGRPEVARSEIDIEWLDRHGPAATTTRPHAIEALLQAAIEAYDQELAVEKSRFLASMTRGRPLVREECGFVVDLRYARQAYRIKVFLQGDGRYRLSFDGHWMEVEVVRRGAFERILTFNGTRFRVLSARQGTAYEVEINGVLHRITRDEQGVVRSPSPAIVLSVHAKIGEEVAAGARLVVLEAMKTEMSVVAPVSGRVREVLVGPSVAVDAGAPLVVLEASASEDVPPEADRVTAGGRPSGVYRALGKPGTYTEVFRARCRRLLGELRQYILGYDVETSSTRWLLREYETLRPDMRTDDEEMLRLELQLVEVFIDVLGVTRSRGGEATPLGLYLKYLRTPDASDLPQDFVATLERLQGLHGETDAAEALYWLHRAAAHIEQTGAVVLRILERLWAAIQPLSQRANFKVLLDHVIEETHDRFIALNELAQQIRFRCFDLPVIESARASQDRSNEECIGRLVEASTREEQAPLIQALVDNPSPILGRIHKWSERTGKEGQALLLEVYLRRFYRDKPLSHLRAVASPFGCHVTARYRSDRGDPVGIVATYGRFEHLGPALAEAQRLVDDQPSCLHDYLLHLDSDKDPEALRKELAATLSANPLPRVHRVCVSALDGGTEGALHFTYRMAPEGAVEEQAFRGIHHMQATRLELWRLQNFETTRLNTAPDVLIFHAVAKTNPKDVRLFVLIDVRQLSSVRNEVGEVVQLPLLERLHSQAMAELRELQYRGRGSYEWNRVIIFCWQPLHLRPEEVTQLGRRLALSTQNLGIEKVVIRAQMPSGQGGTLQDTAVHLSVQAGSVIRMRIERPSTMPIRVVTPYHRRVRDLRRRGLVHPYELVRMLTPKSEGTSTLFPLGTFTEYDLGAAGALVPVERPYGENTANVVLGVIRNVTPRYPEGITRVIILGDPSREMGALAEPECRRIIAALDSAERMRIPIDWFPVSAGAKISMESGTENLDWTARVLRRLIEFTQGGGEVNVVVNGVNVGAQSYWNAEATMLMHTRGILIMTPQASMVLTGKRALDVSGSVSAEDNLGIGGLGIMMPNGQAQYEARDITHACFILLQHYEHSYVVPGERFPRRAATRDPLDRDITTFKHKGEEGSGLETVGEIFSDASNPGRKKPFEIRSVLAAVADQDRPTLERWAKMRGAETAIVLDAFLGGVPACLVGIESRRVPRVGFVPGDGPEEWLGGTLYPLSSKKVARAINAVSGNRPLVMLANLAGFDGSPESMRKLQLEYGAEIGRAVVNFDGPLIFSVISRYHGGAFVVFSRTLNEHLEVSALDGAFASVIGGAPAAEVVFTAEVRARIHKDPRVRELRDQIASSSEEQRLKLYEGYNDLIATVTTEKKREVAEEFDRTHSIKRAREVGSLQDIVPPKELRPFLIGALTRGMERCQDR